MKAKKQSRTFTDFVQTMDYLEVCRITISPNGKFEVPSERDGRVVQVSAVTKAALAKFCREFADRLTSTTSTTKR